MPGGGVGSAQCARVPVLQVVYDLSGGWVADLLHDAVADEAGLSEG